MAPMSDPPPRPLPANPRPNPPSPKTSVQAQNEADGLRLMQDKQRTDTGLGEDPTRDIQALTDARALQEHHFSVQPRKSAMLTPGPAGWPPRGAAVLPPP